MWEVWLSIAVGLSTVLTVLLLCLPSQYDRIGGKHDRAAQDDSATKAAAELPASLDVQILVLGDIGRSPRMQYHAVSIAKHGGRVQLIGYRDSPPHPDVSHNASIDIVPLHSLPAAWSTKNALLFLVVGPLKVLFQIWSLWLVLGYRSRPAKWMIVQNPPAIPTLAVAQVVCFLRHTRLIIDWHNLAYSILALKLGSTHPMVRMSKGYEYLFARRATAHFCVSNVMAQTLREDFSLRSSVLPLQDRPAKHFHPIHPSERAAKLQSLSPLAEILAPVWCGKTRLIVSSTSWTADEDFSVLIDALCKYTEKALTTHPHLPEILTIITGKGPQQEQYVSRIKELEAEGKLEMALIRTIWLDSVADYASLLACADLGVSLHTSSSGLDLPMKVVDMFGAGLPVLGWDGFKAWPELVTEDLNGRGFSDADGLVHQLLDLFGGDWTKLARLKGGAMAESQKRWESEWDGVAGRYLGVM